MQEVFRRDRREMGRILSDFVMSAVDPFGPDLIIRSLLIF